MSSRSRITGHFGSDRESFSNDYTVATDRITVFLEANVNLSVDTMGHVHQQIRKYSDDLSRLMVQKRIPPLHFYVRGVVPEWMQKIHIVSNVRYMIKQLLQMTNESNEQVRLRQGLPLSAQHLSPNGIFRAWAVAPKRAR